MNDVADLVEAAVGRLVDGDSSGARNALAQLDLTRLAEERESAMRTVWGPGSKVVKPALPPGKTPRMPVRVADLTATFERDHFTCRYAHCRRRTIYLPVLKALSKAFPGILPYHSAWRPVSDHLLYWICSTSLEHKISFPNGGTSDPENLITACYLCNDVKNYLTAESLGWTIEPPGESNWMGLRQYIADLVRGGSENSERPLQRSPAETLSTSCDGPSALREGSMIRAILPGKRSRRQYRVDHVSGGRATLTEMWRRDVDGPWVASKNTRTVTVGELDGVSEVRVVAPIEGAIDTRF